MTTPEFREPKPRRHRKMFESPEATARRIAYLERIDRRCIANNGGCLINAATMEFTVQDVNPAGEPVGETYTVKTCTRHAVTVDKAISRFKVHSSRRLPPAEGRRSAPGQ